MTYCCRYNWKKVFLIFEKHGYLKVSGEDTCKLMMDSLAGILKEEDIIYHAYDTALNTGEGFKENLRRELQYTYSSEYKLMLFFTVFLQVTSVVFMSCESSPAVSSKIDNNFFLLYRFNIIQRIFVIFATELTTRIFEFSSVFLILIPDKKNLNLIYLIPRREESESSFILFLDEKNRNHLSYSSLRRNGILTCHIT